MRGLFGARIQLLHLHLHLSEIQNFLPFDGDILVFTDITSIILHLFVLCEYFFSRE